MRKRYVLFFIIVIAILMSFKVFCLPNDFDIIRTNPLIISTENFKKTQLGSVNYRPTLKTIKFGKYLHKNAFGKIEDDIEWIVLAKGDGKALLVSRDVLQTNSYNVYEQPCSFDESSAKAYLNTTFYNDAFTDKEKSFILDYAPTNCKVFILSEYELKLYMGINMIANLKLSPNDQQKTQRGYFAFASYKFYDALKVTGDESNDSDGWKYNESYLVRNDAVSETSKSFYNGKISTHSIKKVDGLRPAIWVSYSQSLQESTEMVGDFLTEVVPIWAAGALVGQFGFESTPLDDISDTAGNIADSIFAIDDILMENNDKGYSIAGFAANNYYRNGVKVKKDWVKWDTEWYYMDGNGEVEKNKWIDYKDNRYYVDGFGKMVRKQWINNTYYVDENGRMLKNTTTPDGYKVDKEGKRKKDKNSSDSFNYVLNLDIDVKAKQSKYVICIKSAKSGSDAKKLGLSSGDVFFEADGEDISDYFDREVQEMVDTSANKGIREETIIEMAVQKFTEYFSTMSFKSIAFKKTNGKVVRLTKEEVIEKISK